MPAQSVVLSPHDPDWARHFEAERALLERVLAPWLEGGIEHVGSTAIPGIAAKPIVDMIAGVRNFEDARAAYEPLHAVGYVDEPHRPEIAHHFADPALAAEYEALKLRLAHQYPGDVRTYTDGKRDFVHRVLVGAMTDFSWR